MESVTPRSSSSEDSPNWLDLPPEVTAAILRKVGVVDILNHVQLVCTYWHTICKDPSMWRSIDLVSTAHLHGSFNIQKLARYVVGRSRGQLVDISIGGYPNDAFIYELAYVSSCQLRRLRIVSCCFTKDLLKQVASKFSTLEELEVQTTPLSVAAVEAIGRCCPRLKTFKCNVFKYIHRRAAYHDDLAKMVAKTMPKLHHLELLRIKITNAGLKAILDGCPSLEILGLCSSYLCNLQVDDLGEAYLTRYKKIVRYQEEPVAVYRYEHEDDDDDWDYDDDDDVVEVEDGDDVDDGDYNDDDEDDDVGEDDDDEDDSVVDDDEDDNVVDDDEDDNLVDDDEDDNVVGDDEDDYVVDDDEDDNVVGDDEDDYVVDDDDDEDHDVVDDDEDDNVVDDDEDDDVGDDDDDDDVVDDDEDDDVVDDDDHDAVDDDDHDAIDYDNDAIGYDNDADHDAIGYDNDADHDAIGYDYDDDDAIGYDYDDDGRWYI